MNVFDYLRHNGDEVPEDEENSQSTMDVIEDKTDNLENLIKNNKEIKYRLKF